MAYGVDIHERSAAHGSRRSPARCSNAGPAGLTRMLPTRGRLPARTGRGLVAEQASVHALAGLLAFTPLMFGGAAHPRGAGAAQDLLAPACHPLVVGVVDRRL